MITINTDKLSDGLYQIQDGWIHKYKAGGGTVRTYEMGEIVRCEDCKNWQEWDNGTGSCHRSENGYNWFGVDATDYCSFGVRREDGEHGSR